MVWPGPARGPLLIVDDGEDFLKSCARLLRREGYAVHTAQCAEEALGLALHQAYKVILMDLKLPAMSGMECLRQLKEKGCRAEVIVLTGYGNIPSTVEAIKAGAWDYLSKPFVPEELVRKIDLLCAHQAQDAGYHDDPVVRYIHEHATAIGAREDVASRFGLSLDTVSTRVRKFTGRAFTEFLHACRLEQARRLLETTELNISQVAARVGFRTPQHFSRVFRKFTGLSPARYRLQQRADKKDQR